MTRRRVAPDGYVRGSSERREKRLLVGSRGGLPHCQIAGSPLSSSYRSRPERASAHQGNDLGDGNNAGDWVTCSQILRAPGLRMQFND
jgi:hypothetical protein